MPLRLSLPASWMLIALVLAPLAASAQDNQPEKEFSTQQLDQMLAPIALYPDDLLTNVLVASTYPLEVVQAARWRQDGTNVKLKGEPLEKALDGKDWDPSVKSLVLFPDVLQTMNDKLDWTQKLGDAFLAQQSDVMDRVQFLRQKADDAGFLKTNEKQKVSKRDNAIIIEPANPDVVYVPVYQPTVVYGSWWYPDYPPYYWYWDTPPSYFVSGFFWGTGLAIGTSLWRWGHWDWHHHDIDINVDRYNRINANRAQITSNKWVHDPRHRGSVPYRGKEARDKFGKSREKLDSARQDFRGFDKDKLGDKAGNKIRDGAGRDGDLKDRAGQGGQKVKDKAGDRTPKKDLSDKARSRESPSKALDVKRKGEVKKQVDRGQVSRKSAAKHVSAPPMRAVQRGGGGINRGGGIHRGGGMHRGGGGRGRR